VATEATSTANDSTSGLATAAGIGAIAFWCWSGPCFAAGSRAIGSMPYVAFTSVVGVITGMVFHRARGQALADLFRLPRRVIVAGFFGVAVYTVVMTGAVGMASDSDLGQIILINYLWPIWIIVLGLLLLDEKPRIGLTLVAAALGFGGVVVSKGLEPFTRPPAGLVPHALAMIAAFLWALYSVLLKRWRVPEENCGSTGQFIVCAFLATGVGALNGQWEAMPVPDASAVFWILFGGIGPIGLGYYLWEIGIKRGAAHMIALLAYFIPVVSALLIGLLFREAISPGLLPGALMIVAGAYLGSRANKPTTRPRLQSGTLE
jgi:drug/metabolite transporter (DMT)-like permease